MKDWVEKLNAFLQFNEEDVLQGKGKVTHEIAKAFAEEEFEKFRVIRDATYKSDFDMLMEATAQYTHNKCPRFNLEHLLIAQSALLSIGARPLRHSAV